MPIGSDDYEAKIERFREARIRRLMEQATYIRMLNDDIRPEQLTSERLPTQTDTGLSPRVARGHENRKRRR